MYCDDKFDYWIDLLCTCESDWKCEWHKRLGGRYASRRELGEQMENIVTTSQAIYMGIDEVPEGWELIRGNRGEYWAPPNRGY